MASEAGAARSPLTSFDSRPHGRTGPSEPISRNSASGALRVAQTTAMNSSAVRNGVDDDRIARKSCVRAPPMILSPSTPSTFTAMPRTSLVLSGWTLLAPFE